MKVMILAGGMGSRLSEETAVRPKPMVQIGGHPILWHIMKIYATHGLGEFLIALGHKAEMIKEYFLRFNEMNNDLSVDLAKNRVTVHDDGDMPDWKVHLVDTGQQTQTGGRIKRLEKWIGSDEDFVLSYGDGVADLDISALIDFHRSHGKLATVASVRSPARFGRLVFEGDQVVEFFEKPDAGEGWINGGFFVLNRRVFEYIEGDESIWERDPIERIAHDGELVGFRHFGFWSCMDTLKEKLYLEDLWASGKPPWKIWD
jgi:glucose-1-phosphate cytidylyltransferase